MKLGKILCSMFLFALLAMTLNKHNSPGGGLVVSLRGVNFRFWSRLGC